MINSHSQTVRTFFHSVAAGATVAAALALVHHNSWSAGFAIGAVTSLFSLFSLKVCVPVLFHKGATARATALLQVVLLMKLPFYATALYFATRMGSGPAFAAFGGCALVPCVITLETLTRMLIDSNAHLRRAAAMHSPVALSPQVEEFTKHVALLKADACESAPLAAQILAATEGAR